MRKAAQIFKHLLPKAIRRLLFRVGCYVRCDEEFPSIESSLRYLRSWGFEPRTVIDIGAYHGEWSKLFNRIFPKANILMIEGQREQADTLNCVCTALSGKAFCEIALLGASHEKEVEFIHMATGSSIFEEASSHGRYREKRTLETLDSIVSQRRLEFQSPDFLKLDVQGYELEVLKGAMQTLSRSEFVLLEASLLAVNDGCPLVPDVIAFMAANDFRLLDICSQIRRKDSALWQTDLLFISNASRFVPKAVLDSSNWD